MGNLACHILYFMKLVYLYNDDPFARIQIFKDNILQIYRSTIHQVRLYFADCLNRLCTQIFDNSLHVLWCYYK